MSQLPEVATLWIGGRLSWLEQLCLTSFVEAGHHTTLYTYDPVDNVPDGVHRADAREIFDASTIIRHTRTGSPAIHADIWRLHLISKTQKVWIDADMYCYRPFDFQSDHVFGLEKPGMICNAVLGLPSDSPALAGMLASFDDVLRSATDGTPLSIEEQKWGSTGPHMVTKFLTDSGEIKHQQAVDVFYPIPFRNRNHMILSRFDPEEELTENTKGIHFWARRLKPRLAEKENNKPRRGSFLHKLLRKHGIDTGDAPLPGWTPDVPERTEAIACILDGTRPQRRTRIVDVGANPINPPPYKQLFAMEGCDVVGFEPHPEAYAALLDQKSERETYFPFAIGDGSTEQLNIYRDSGLTSIFTPFEPAFSFLGRSRGNMALIEATELKTRRLDDIDEVGVFDLLKIDIQGAEVKVFAGGRNCLKSAIAVVVEVRFYQLYEDEPMVGGVDESLRALGFQFHKFIDPKSKVIPNSQIDRLKRSRHRNQIIDADAVYLREPGELASYSDEQLKHLSILAAAVFESDDLALYCLDALVSRGVIDTELPARYVDALPKSMKK